MSWRLRAIVIMSDSPIIVNARKMFIHIIKCFYKVKYLIFRFKCTSCQILNYIMFAQKCCINMYSNVYAEKIFGWMNSNSSCTITVITLIGYFKRTTYVKIYIEGHWRVTDDFDTSTCNTCQGQFTPATGLQFYD